MYILNSARHEKKSKTLIPDGNGKNQTLGPPGHLVQQVGKRQGSHG